MEMYRRLVTEEFGALDKVKGDLEGERSGWVLNHASLYSAFEATKVWN
jgi:hypothetical protein